MSAWLFLKKSHTARNLAVHSNSENALSPRRTCVAPQVRASPGAGLKQRLLSLGRRAPIARGLFFVLDHCAVCVSRSGTDIVTLADFRRAAPSRLSHTNGRE
jgi:hypothetical protein